jgi:hypothetical protein
MEGLECLDVYRPPNLIADYRRDLELRGEVARSDYLPPRGRIAQ